MSTSNKLETQITTDDGTAGATLKAMMAKACRLLQRNAATQHLQVDDLDIYNEIKRQVTNSSPTSTIPSGHICRDK